MLPFLIIILCINIDAFSYGVAYGFKRQKMRVWYILLVTILSTFLFAVPLIISKYVFQYFNEIICNIINGLVLIFLGIYYFSQKPPDFIENQPQKTKNNQIKGKKYILEKSKIAEISFKNSENNYKKFVFKEYFVESLIISVDAIFTALLSGFTSNLLVFYIIFYAFSNFFAIFLGNYITYRTNRLFKFKLSFLSGTIFVVLGVLKCFGI